MPYLLKTEPSEYSFADLQRDKETIWDGVTNPVALKNLRAMQPKDELVIYHTGDEKSAVGTATVISVDNSDAKNPRVKIKAGKLLAKQRFTSGSAGKTQRGAADGRAVSIPCRQLNRGLGIASVAKM